ncbi:MAG: diguanylate cyclase (GGDEF)-like protein [Candidatus Azotimanducaceae bacterium]|jgi:diguanylate cyclase (GGDEF)-like protein
MQKSKIYGVMSASTVLIGGVMIFLQPDFSVNLIVTICLGLLIAMIVPAVLISMTINKLQGDVDGKLVELRAQGDELSTLKAKFSAVTTLDDLTGCSNKRHFMDSLMQHRAMSERGTYEFTVAITQVDQFTEIVEKQGLGRGNEVLQLFSRIVKAALREVDVIARMESDKFALILSGCSEQDALQIITRISQLIGQIQVNHDDQDDIKITSSGGITSFHGTETTEDLIEHAEQALVFAIEQGRDRVAGYNYVRPEETTES